MVYDQQGGGAVWAFQQGSGKTNVTLRGRLRISAAEGIREAVLDDWHLPSIALWAVFPTGRQASAKARAFVAFVESRMAQARLSRCLIDVISLIRLATILHKRSFTK